MKYEITRSELRTRRWIVEADSEDEALDAYPNLEPVYDEGVGAEVEIGKSPQTK